MPELSKFDVINNLKNLPKCDKEYLIKSIEKNTTDSIEIYKNLSIFSKKITFETLNEYTYLRTFENCNIFYLNLCKNRLELY